MYLHSYYMPTSHYHFLAGEDYVDPGPAILRFEAGDSRMCVQIIILNDNILESAECFYVDLVSFVEGIETSTTKIQINDDEGGKKGHVVCLSISCFVPTQSLSGAKLGLI